MTRFLLSSAAALTLCAASLYNPALQSQTHATYKASIPFEFQVDKQIMPAGTYMIDPLSPHLLRLWHKGDGRSANLLVFPVDEAAIAGSGELRFARYGDVYFLHEFSAPTQRADWHAASRCIPSSTEERLIRRRNTLIPMQRQSPPEVAINLVSTR